MAKVSLELELEQLAQAILQLSEEERQQLWSLLATLLAVNRRYQQRHMKA